MTVLCPKCKTGNTDESKFCNECGLQLESVNKSDVFSPRTKTIQIPVKELEAGTTIADKYKLIDELGRGGMGVVYLAEQFAPVKRKVAVKIIKVGMDTKQVIARFEAERQALALTIASARIAAERDRAEKEAAKATAINDFLQDTLGSANPIEGSGKDITVLEALETASNKIEEAFSNQPEVEAEVRHTIGVTYLRLGQYDKAEDMLKSALSVARRAYPPDDPELAAPLTSLAVLLHERGKLDNAEALYREALEIRQKNFGREDEGAASILSNLGVVLQDKGDYEGAEAIFLEILDIDRKLLGDDDLNVAIDLNNLGNILRDKGKYEDGESYLREAIAILQKHKHPWVSVAMSNLGELMNRKGDYRAAEPIFQEALTIGLDQLGDKNQDIAKLQSRYGECLLKLGRYEEAENKLLAALPILMDSLGERNAKTQQTIGLLIELYEALDEKAEAAKYRKLLFPREN